MITFVFNKEYAHGYIHTHIRIDSRSRKRKRRRSIENLVANQCTHMDVSNAQRTKEPNVNIGRLSFIWLFLKKRTPFLFFLLSIYTKQ